MSEQDRIVELLEQLDDQALGKLKRDIFNTLEEVYSLEYHDLEDEDIFEFYAEKVIRYSDILGAERRTWKNLCGPDAPWPPEGAHKVSLNMGPTLDGPVYQYVAWLPGTLEQLEDYYEQLADEIFDDVGSKLIRYKHGRKFGVVEGGKP